MARTEKQKINVLTFSTIALGVLFAGAVGYIFMADVGRGNQIDEGVLQHCIQDAEIDVNLVAHWNARRPITPDHGEFISFDSAFNQFHRFHRPPRPTGVPYSFAFGVNKIQAFLDSIKSKNASIRNTDADSIAGVRIYLTKRFTDVSGHGKKRHTDVLLIPVRLSGKNFVDISDPNGKKTSMIVDGDPLILNTSSPCPDMCNEK